MVFNSAVFIYFALVVLFVYFLLGRFPDGTRYQNRFLLIASYVFYGYWDWLFLGLIFISTITDYFVSIGIEHFDREDSQKKRGFLLWTSVAVNLGLLGAFKYYDFFIESFVVLVRSVVPDAFPDAGESLLLRVVLPVGISFYTFQTMSYTIDVYRRVIRAERSFLDFALFVCFFPQLVAGPIERAGDLLPMLKNKRPVKLEDIEKGVWLLLLGFYLKVYVADNLAPLVDMVFLPGKYLYESNPGLVVGQGGAQVATASMAFILQIYGDFAGYSFIAMGIARILGVRLSQNFDAPQYSKTPDELWNRWHTTLGRWVRDYIYIPLGGSRNGRLRSHWNLFVTFVLMGFWHGANWTFVLWGAFNGLWVVTARIWRKSVPSLEDRLSGWKAASISALKRLGVFIGFSFSGTMFRSYDLNHSVEIWKSMLTIPWDTSGSAMIPSAGVYAADVIKKVIPLLLLDYMAFRKNSVFWIFDRPVWLRTIIYTYMFYEIVIHGVFGKDVIYFAF